MLLTNDDGVAALGLASLREVMSDFGEVVVVAPDIHYSGCSHQTTTDRPLELKELEPGRFVLNGTPADCTRIGLLEVIPDADWVLSGINDGANLGVDIYMSGTVAAAREAALMGRRSIAVSQYRTGRSPIDWALAQEMVRAVVPELMQEWLPSGAYWNINLPHLHEQHVPEVVRCNADPDPLPVRYERENDLFHYRGDYHGRPRQPGLDVDVCFSGRIAVSLMQRVVG